jgi:Holliday junction DNA helicase RuvB
MPSRSTTTPERLENEREFDQTIRPLQFAAFVGQPKIIENLTVFIKAARQRHEPLDHVLFTGPPGLGKTTLAYIIANELESNIKVTSGPVLDRASDLAGVLTNLEEGDVLFIDEIHRLNPVVEEYLYSAMEDYRLDIMIDSGPSARSVQISLPRFTLVGATTRAGLLTSPLRSRFGITNRLDYYSADDLTAIVKRSASILGIKIEDEGAIEIARRSRGTPRISNRLLRRCRDFAEADTSLAHFGGIVTKDVAHVALTALEVDEKGLDDMDKRILLTIIDKHNGGPVGLTTIAVAVGEESGTIEEVYEPYLIQEGFLKRTLRGREVTPFCYTYFKKRNPASPQQSLGFNSEQS